MRRAASLALLVPFLAAQESQPASTPASSHDTPFSAEQTARIPWRCIGPANMGGRITDIEVQHGNASTIYVATAGGGLWKTVNAGTTWEISFHDQPTNSIGDVAVAPSNPQIVWVGSGEENARNSVSYGDGVYKSTDGGKTFTNVGLTETFQIGHIAIHPSNPDVVYVGALGRLWGANEERGVFRTKDGGKSWEKVLYVDARTGCIDVRVDHEHPDTVYAVMYHRERDGFDGNDPSLRFSKTSGLYRSDDGGTKWKKLTAGLPSCAWGRCGIDLYRKSPTTVFAIIETERSGWASGTSQAGDGRPRPGSAYLGMTPEDTGNGVVLATVSEGGPAASAGLKVGDMISMIGDAKITTGEELTGVLGRARSGEKVKFRIVRDNAVQDVEVTFGVRPGPASQPGGGGPGGGGPGGGAPRLGGQNPNLQDTQGDMGFETGGVFRSDDRGETWKRINSLTERPFYYSVIAVDPSDDKHLYSVGINLWHSEDGGANFKLCQRGIHVDFHAIWVDPQDGKHVLAGCDGGLNVSWDRTASWEMQRNVGAGQFYHVAVDNAQPYHICGGLQDNGTWYGPSRTRFNEGIAWDDCYTIYGGDGFGACFDPEDDDVVFATSQNGAIGWVNLKTGAQRRVQKPQGANSWNWDTPFFLSPHNPRLLYFAGNRACRSLDRGGRSESISENLGLTSRGTASAFAESPLTPGLLYVGTDDGAFWRTKDHGRSWTELHKKLPLPGARYVSSIHPSRFRANRVYATCDGHRSDDCATHVFASEDAGDTWTSIGVDLPESPVHVCREDPTNENLLYVGTEFSAFVSLDRGVHWLPLGLGLPTVAVRDFAIQGREQELVAATHGRGVWILDIAPLRQLTREVAEKPAHLFVPKALTLWHMESRGALGHKELFFGNPPNTFTLHLLRRPAEAPTLTIHDIAGTQVASLTGKRSSGIQTVTWATPRNTKAGNYSVRCKVGEETLIQPFAIVADPQDEKRNAATSEAR